MNTQEKQAWFTILVIAATLAAYAILYAITRSPTVALASFSITALLAAQGLIDRKERGSGRTIADERDQEINRTAGVAAFGIFWVVFVAAVMVPFFILGPNAPLHMKTTTLPTVLYPALCIVVLVRALVMIVLYRKGQHV